MKALIDMTDDEIKDTLSVLEAKWKEFRASIDDEGMAGSPGESLIERMDALETEQRKRKQPNLLRCRFCSWETQPTKYGKPNFGAMRAHVADKHRTEYEKIKEHATARERETKPNTMFATKGKASVSREFRRAMGYRSGAPGAEQNDEDES